MGIYRDFFKDQTGECIPTAWRCDGTKDCPEGDDEEFCGVFTCTDEEYTCTNTGKCISKTFLCDGFDDCGDGQDEVSSTCLKNGVDPSKTGCVADGYYYTCANFADTCVYKYQMCDGYQDCPLNDDEDSATCAALLAAETATTSAPKTLECGKSVISSFAVAGSVAQYDFTMPADKTYVKISMCDSGNEGPGYTYMTQTDDSTVSLYSELDTACPCSNRGVIFGGPTEQGEQYKINPGKKYDLYFQGGFVGKSKLTVTCGTSPMTGGGSCTETFSGFGTTFAGQEFGTPPGNAVTCPGFPTYCDCAAGGDCAYTPYCGCVEAQAASCCNGVTCQVCGGGGDGGDGGGGGGGGFSTTA